ncbi:MAG: SusC/RagA family TonB-linked outer membrane protein [Bacteroidota bacterium]
MRKMQLMLAVLVLCSGMAFAQTRTISGVVRDDKGNPVSFASVQLKGNKNGVSADADGRFTIKANTGDKLVVTALGLEKNEFAVGAQDVVSITLSSNTKDLSEVVVTGAYNTKRTARSTSYNAQVVNAEQLNTIRQTNLNNALAGKVSGIQVRSQSAAALGRTGQIRLRGTDGFGLGGDVVYVVDGTILPSADGVNMDDVEDVTVLQGPAASAQFGSQGGNGAIVITLKKGKKGRGIGVDVNTGAQFDNVYILPNYQNSYAGGNVSDMYKYTWQAGQPEEWKALDGKYYHDYSDDASWGPRMVGQEHIPWYSWYGGHSRSYTTTPLIPQPDNSKDFYNTGITLNNTVSFSKSSDNANIRVSYGNIDVKGIIPTSSLKKNTFNLNSSFDLNSHFTIGANVNYITSKIRGEVEDDGYSNQSTGSFNQWFHRDLDMGIMKELKGLRTADGIYGSWNKANPNGFDPNNQRNFYAGNYWYNFYSYFDLVDQTTAYDRLYGDLNVTYKINNDLKLKATYRKQQNTTWNESKYSSDLAQSGLQTSGNSPETLGFYGANNSYSNRQNLEFLASFSKKISDFQLNINAGTDFFKSLAKSTGGSTNNGLSVPNLFTLQNSKNPATLNNGRSEEKYNAVFGLGSLGYKNFAFVDFSLRNDWYSTLPPDDNAILSKSIGGSFVFSDLIKIPSISFAKLRASWGEIPQALGTTTTTFGFGRYPGALYGVGQDQWNGNILMGTPDGLVDSAIRGSVKTQKEIGLEMRFLKNRVGFAVTYWDGSEIDMPQSVTLNGATGITGFLTNIGKITKKGVDVQFNIRPIEMKNLKWNINATWGYLLEQKVVDLNSDGDFDDATAVLQNVWGGANALPGIVHKEGMQWGQIFGNGMKRINGVPVITDAGQFVNDPSVYFGSVLPRYTGGIQNSLEIFGNFLVNVNIDYQSGGKFVSLSNMWGSYSGLTARTATVNDKGNPIRDAVVDGGGVHVFGVDADGKPKDVYVEGQSYFQNLYSTKAFDPYVYDLTFVKLREVSIGYNIPVKKLGIDKWMNKAVFSVVARNPILIYAKTKDFDPAEISASSGESGQYPGTRGFGFNLKVSL